MWVATSQFALTAMSVRVRSLVAEYSPAASAVAFIGTGDANEIPVDAVTAVSSVCFSYHTHARTFILRTYIEGCMQLFRLVRIRVGCARERAVTPRVLRSVHPTSFTSSSTDLEKRHFDGNASC